MKTKIFDCVEMMHRAAGRIYSKTRNMTTAEELTYWEKRSDELLPTGAHARSKPMVAHEPRAVYRTSR